MSAEVAIQTKRLLERVTHEWAPLAPILEEMIAVVPPGKALRKYESIKSHQDKLKTTGYRRPELSEAEKIRSGANAMARDSVITQRKTKIEVEKREDGQEWVRLKPVITPDMTECPACHRPLDPTVPVASTPTQPVIRPLATVTHLFASRPNSMRSGPSFSPNGRRTTSS